MLLSTPEQIKRYHEDGLWGEMRLDQIFSAHAEQAPDDIAMIDDQDLMAVCGRQPQCLSYRRCEKRISSLTTFFAGIGIKSDTVIAMMLPPSVDATILCLTASRMGLIVAPLPLTLGEADLRARLERINAKAVICCARYEKEPVGEHVRNVAAELFSIRFVFGVGEGAPEGLISLDAYLDNEESDEAEQGVVREARHGADHILAIHWSAASDQAAQPLGRSHNQLLAASRHLADQSDVAQGDCVVIAHHLSGLVGFTGGLVLGLDCGARMQFHHFRSLQGLINLLTEFGGQHITLPQGQWAGFHERLVDPVREQLSSVALVWNRFHDSETGYRPNETAARILDVTNINDLAIHAQIRREPGKAGQISLGAIKGRKDQDTVWFETFLYGLEEARAVPGAEILGGELCVRGAMIPQMAFPVAGAHVGEALSAHEDGFIHTGIGCRVLEPDTDPLLFSPIGDLSDLIAIGGLTERASDLDALYASCDCVMDAAAFVAEHPGTGRKQLMAALVIEDATGDEVKMRERFFAFLEAERVSSFKWPRDILFVQAIPRQTNGQILRSSLCEALPVSAVA